MLRLHCINEASQVKISLRTILWKSDPGYCAYMITWHSGMCEKRKLDFHGISEIMATSWPGKIGLNHVWRLYTPSMKKYMCSVAPMHDHHWPPHWSQKSTTWNQIKEIQPKMQKKWILIPSVFPPFIKLSAAGLKSCSQKGWRWIVGAFLLLV